MSRPLRVICGWPASELSPNARVHPMSLHRFKKAAKEEAGWATKSAIGNEPIDLGDGDIPIRIIANPPMAWRTGDEDNLIARCKAHLDAIAKALGVNDRRFKQKGVEFAERSHRPQVVFEIGGAA